MTDERGAPLLSTGEFSRRARLTVKALRIYDRIDLLRPAVVDEANGYRRYDPSQIRVGQLIALLRGADLSLEQIRLVLAGLAEGSDVAVDQLERLMGEIDHRHANRRLLIRHVQTTLRGGDSMFPIATRHVPSYRVMSIQRRLRVPETDGFVREAKAAFVERLDGAEPTGPLLLIFHGEVNEESDGPVEAALGCPDYIQANDLVGIRTEPAHDEAYTRITKAQWAYPAILAAYDAVACSAEVKERPNSPLSCREVYLVEPGTIRDDDLVCDIAFPLADR